MGCEVPWQGSEAHTCLGSVGVFSRGIASIRFLDSFVSARRVVLRPNAKQASGLDAVVGWGHKLTAAKARRYAERHELPYLRLEDGFLRSAGLGSKGQPISIVLDDEGIYYDATQPSRLERLLSAGGDELSASSLLDRARRCRQAIVDAGLSKYNHAVEPVPQWLLDAPRPRILVVDQTRNDASVTLGGASADSFAEMLDAALVEHPEATLLVKTHPDVWAGQKQGYLAHVQHPRVRMLTGPTDPALLLDAVDEVYTVSSQLGFEALLRDKPVTCFGLPFYAGWGLTRDRQTLERRNNSRSVDQLVAAALILYPRYVHPVTGERVEVEEAIEHLALQRCQYLANSGVAYCFGFSSWKQRYVRQFLASPDGRIVFCNSARQARRKGIDSDSRVIVWGSRAPQGLKRLAHELAIQPQTMEDGFLRSVGLGSDFSPPLSLVLDARGIYYDPTQPNDFEHLVESHNFQPDELQRARSVRQRLVALGLSKYNFRARGHQLGPIPTDRRVLFVPGQVADDASILLGSPRYRCDADLLREVRRRHPDAYILYKVHPEVVTGNRGTGHEQPAPELYDQVVTQGSLEECLRIADEIHTMTSLVGFEALLRKKRVVTYGQPFYAGWGLTEDTVPIARRSRRLTLDELVVIALLKYPRYYSWNARAFTTAEYALDELKALGATRGASLRKRSGAVRRTLRRATTWAQATLPRKPTRVARGLEGRHIVLLQGPVGPFFARLAQALELSGAQVTKVNFNAADDFFYRRSGVVPFREPMNDWAGFFEQMLKAKPTHAIMLFGDCRAHHRTALRLAEQHGIPAYVFEEGYIRPDHVTLERGGVNANSTLPRSLEPYLTLADKLARQGAVDRVEKVEHGFRMLAWYSVLYSAALTLGSARYPEYRHHKDLNSFRQIFNWSRGLARKAWYFQRERSKLSQLCTQQHKNFFLVPLQVHHDAQVVHSRFGSNEALIAEVIGSFAEHAGADVHLVFKHHPLDRAYRDYGNLIARHVARLNLRNRVHYIHDLHLPSLLRAARGTVVLNSTTGCSSLYHGTPVKVLGAAVYDLDGLTFQGSLARFWQDPGTVDAESFAKYRSALIAMSQLNGCFYSRDVASDVVRRLLVDLHAGQRSSASGGITQPSTNPLNDVGERFPSQRSFQG